MSLFFLLTTLILSLSFFGNPFEKTKLTQYSVQKTPTVIAQDINQSLLDSEYSPTEPTVPYTDPTTAMLEYQSQEQELTLTQDTLGIATTTKPNIVIIMLDDVNPVDGRLFTLARTPGIYNNIISKGINFTNFYGETSLCCPGRVGFFTGQHTQNHGVADLDGTKFNPDVSIATKLQAKGYYTMLTGKYLNNYINFPQSELIPPGWNKFDAILAINSKYYDYDWISKDGKIVHYDKDPSDYSTDVIARVAVQRLKEAPVDKPIFAILNPYATHEPYTVAPRHIGDSRCADIAPWNAPNVNEEDVSDKPAYVRSLPKQTSTTGHDLTVSCEQLLSVDDMVRKVKNELINQGRLSNTLFILTADNGFSFGEHRFQALKTIPYTTHIPFYIAWPAGRGTSPKIVSTIASNIDLAPTLCELAGCVMGPYPNGQQKSDGISFLSIVKNKTVLLGRDAILESQSLLPDTTRPTWWAIRTTSENSLGLWHYVEYSSGEKELYDLSKGPCYRWTPSKGGDPCELTNLLSPRVSAPAGTLEIKDKLAARLAQLKKEKGYTAPTPTP